ncbi:hypothetical protein EMIT043CA1_110190 [Pseudomonas brassicacearum]
MTHEYFMVIFRVKNLQPVKSL